MTRSFPSISDIEDDAWDEVARSSPDGWTFSLRGWQRIVTGVAAWEFQERSFAITEGKRILAVVPLHYRTSHKTMASSGWGGSGPVLAESLSKPDRESVFAAALDRMIEICAEDAAETLDVSCYPVTKSSLENRWGVNPFQLHGFEDVSLLSQVIDLSQSEADIWNSFAQSARQAIRKSEKAGFRAERVGWSDMLDAYYECHVETYARTGVEPHPRAYFEGIARHTAPVGASALFAACSPGGEPLAFHNDARFGMGSNYHTGCSRSSTRGAGLDYLLMWYAILDAKRNNCQWYDCGWVFPGTSDPKQMGLTLFKTRFGGDLHRAFRGRIAFHQEHASPLDMPVIPDISSQPPRPPSLLSRLGSRLGWERHREQ